ncbi:class I SAM-dependent methyltransferase [Pontibacter sp. HSC-14F20]|uniref:class I SAM-dependent methyltransferase n=1 Tax=Pontibacter sp. HSC-14F20 TaxID=2864136 RepID=UPI001C73DAED|nr:methyltransferase domain-containing protein [Pontibacter sp. HSC-14F20]MBX0332575.1 class I SAM-dependent methyltransferase [Pontibacter sp. HSC-14F20]
MKENTIQRKRGRPERVADFAHHVLDDLSAAERVRMSFLGSQLGLYRVMANAGPMTVGQIARSAGASVKLVKHWADSLAADGYLLHEPEADTFCLPEAHAIAMTDPTSPYYVGNRFMKGNGDQKGRSHDMPVLLAGNHAKERNLLPVDVSGRFFSEEYLASLLHSWIPGVEGLAAKLETGILVADLGSGRHGASTLVMARVFPNSTFLGFDRYNSSVERANLLAKEKHIPNAHFELATDVQVYAYQYDLITLIESANHMGDTLQDLLTECRQVLKTDGVLVVAEAKDSSSISEEQYQRLRSTRVIPTVAEHVYRVERGIDGHEHELQKAATAAGFSVVRKVAETWYDKVYEMRP